MCHIFVKLFLIVLFVNVQKCSKPVKTVNARCDLPCKTPQKRVFNITKEFNLTGVTTRPTKAVWYRCEESTGCCKGTKEICQVSKLDPIKLLVTVDKKIRGFVYDNHTECSCQTKDNDEL